MFVQLDNFIISVLLSLFHKETQRGEQGQEVAGMAAAWMRGQTILLQREECRPRLKKR